MVRPFANHFGASTILFGALAIASFWFALQLCWAMRGKSWSAIAWRCALALGLVAFGVVMIFMAAFEA